MHYILFTLFSHCIGYLDRLMSEVIMQATNSKSYKAAFQEARKQCPPALCDTYTKVSKDVLVAKHLKRFNKDLI